MKKDRDVKFIIYQVLYIFVIVVMTMKGADLNLDMMLPKDKVVFKTYSDSLKAYIDSLEALGLVPRVEFDSIRNQDYKIPPVQDLTGYIKVGSDQVVMYKKDVITKEETSVEPNKQEKQIELKVVQPTQYTNNSIRNNNDEPLQVYADGRLVNTIPANGSGVYQLKGEKTVRYVCGNSSKDVSTLENRTQKINFQSISVGNPEKSLRDLQSTVGWRVIIDDDFIDQIKVTVKGLIKVEDKGKGVYDVKLFVCQSKEQFERLFGEKDAPYKVSFTVTATDIISGKSVSQQRDFIFGEW